MGLTLNPLSQQADQNNALYVGGFLYYGAANMDTKTNPVDVYDNETFSGLPIANPQVLNARGTTDTAVYVNAEAISMRLEDSLGNLIWEVPYVPTAKGAATPDENLVVAICNRVFNGAMQSADTSLDITITGAYQEGEVTGIFAKADNFLGSPKISSDLSVACGSSGRCLTIRNFTSGANGKNYICRDIPAENVGDLLGGVIYSQCQVFQETGVSLNYRLNIYSADAENDFTTVSLIGNGAYQSVASGVDTKVYQGFDLNGFPNAANGIRLEVECDCGVIGVGNDFKFNELALVAGTELLSYPREKKEYAQIYDDLAQLIASLGTAAYVNTGTGAGNVPTTAEADARYLRQSQNLADLSNVATARANLGIAINPDFVYGLDITLGAAPTTDFDIATGQAANTTATEIITLLAALTKQTDNTWAAGDNAGGMASANHPIAAWTTYNIYVIEKDDGATTDVVFASSVANALLPDGVTVYDNACLVAGFWTDGSALIHGFCQKKNLFKGIDKCEFGTTYTGGWDAPEFVTHLNQVKIVGAGGGGSASGAASAGGDTVFESYTSEGGAGAISSAGYDGGIGGDPSFTWSEYVVFARRGGYGESGGVTASYGGENGLIGFDYVNGGTIVNPRFGITGGSTSAGDGNHGGGGGGASSQGGGGGGAAIVLRGYPVSAAMTMTVGVGGAASGAAGDGGNGFIQIDF